MSGRSLRVGLVQMKSAGDAESNLRQAAAGVEEAAERGARLVCLPELFLGDYFCQSEDPALFDLAEEIPGATTRSLAALAKRLEVSLVTSIFERRGEGVYHNSAPVFDSDGSLLGVYRKMHIPDDPLYYEKFYFAPGDRGFQVFATRAARVGTLICWDQWFPEAARLTAMQGAELLVYPTAIGWHHAEKDSCGAQQRDAWETVQRSHAIANGVFVAAVNRVGSEGGLEFWGSSFLCSPNGEVLVRAGASDAEVVVADCDLSEIATMRRNWPFFRDRRIDAYDGLSKRYLDGSS